MLCDCLDEIKKKVKEQNNYKKQTKNVEIVDIVLLFANSGSQTRTVTHIEVELEGQKKKEKVNMLHTFCPFCGKRQENREKEVVVKEGMEG